MSAALWVTVCCPAYERHPALTLDCAVGCGVIHSWCRFILAISTVNHRITDSEVSEGRNCHKKGGSPPFEGGETLPAGSSHPCSRVFPAAFPLTSNSPCSYGVLPLNPWRPHAWIPCSSDWALHTVSACTPSHIEVLLTLLHRRRWQCLLNPGSSPCEHEGPLSQQKTAANLSRVVPLNIPLTKWTVSNESQARNETRTTSTPN